MSRNRRGTQESSQGERPDQTWNRTATSGPARPPGCWEARGGLHLAHLVNPPPCKHPSQGRARARPGQRASTGQAGPAAVPAPCRLGRRCLAPASTAALTNSLVRFLGNQWLPCNHSCRGSEQARSGAPCGYNYYESEVKKQCGGTETFGDAREPGAGQNPPPHPGQGHTAVPCWLLVEPPQPRVSPPGRTWPR